MSEPPVFPRLILLEGYSEADLMYAADKGCLPAQAEMENGVRFPVYFIHPTRLFQDVRSSASNGEPCYSEPGMVAVTEFTRTNLTASLRTLASYGFFDHLKAINDNG